MTNQPALSIPSVSDCDRLGVPMPDFLMGMEEALGVEPVREFLRVWAGREFKIRSTTSPANDPLRDVIEWLRTEIGWGAITVPMGPTSRHARLRLAIYTGLMNGKSISKLAHDLQCHTRTVSSHKKTLVSLGLLKPGQANPKGT